MAAVIIPRSIRGRLYFQFADVLFATWAEAATAWSAAEAHRLDVVEPSVEASTDVPSADFECRRDRVLVEIADEACDHRLVDLIVQRTEALADMRNAGNDFAAFSIASKREAALSAEIRCLRRQGGAV